MKKNNFWFLSLAALWIIGIACSWTVPVRFALAANAVIVLASTVIEGRRIFYGKKKKN